jgi:acyl-CoA reductase-like NAD-dependent aldehyde dehydrogenase
MARLGIDKTFKLYCNGAFIRSESGRTMPIQTSDGRTANVAKASRKDLRDTVRAARAAQGPWSGRTAYNRGQILYRIAEMLDGRVASLPTDEADAVAAVDRAVHHAGWADKVTAVLSSLNPVAATYVNYSRIRPLGVVVAAPDPADKLLGMIEAVCASAVMSNSTLLVVPVELGELAAGLAETLATSDVPGGVINVLTGDVPELLALASKHDDIDGLYVAGAKNQEALPALREENARVMRRMLTVDGAKAPATPIELQQLAEVQTVWMSAYEPRGGAPAY